MSKETKVTKSKNATKKATEVTADKEVQQEEVSKKAEKKVRKKLDEHMLVPIASGVHGGLTYIESRSGKVWRFENYNDEDVMELREIRTMLSSHRKFLQKGWIRVLDDEVVEYLNLERFQQENIEPEDLESLLDMKPEKITEMIKNSSTNAKRIIYGFAKEKYINGELVNIHIVRAIEEGLGESLDPNI